MVKTKAVKGENKISLITQQRRFLRELAMARNTGYVPLVCPSFDAVKEIAD